MNNFIKMIVTPTIGIAALLLLFLLFNSLFIVSEYEQAIVTQLGRPVRVVAGESPFTDKEMIQSYIDDYSRTTSPIGLSFGAGLYFKLPFIQTVEFFEDRLMEYDSEPAPITSKDKKRLLVDTFARWRINEPLLFKQSLGNVTVAINRIDNIIKSEIRNTLGEHDFIDIIRSTDALLNDTRSQIAPAKLVPVKGGRDSIMKQVTEKSSAASEKYGILIVDVRIKRADPPAENLQAIYENMKSERQRIAQLYRKEGERNAEIIKAETDREVKTMIAEAKRQARVIEGDADADAARIFANGFEKELEDGSTQTILGFESNPEFYRFLRTLDALETSLDSQTSLILNTDNDLLRYLERMDGE